MHREILGANFIDLLFSGSKPLHPKLVISRRLDENSI